MTYKYKCNQDHSFETDQKISEDAITKCIICGNDCERVPFTGKDANGAFEVNGYNAGNGYS